MDTTLARQQTGDPRTTLQEYNKMLHTYDVHHDKYKKTPILPPTITQTQPVEAENVVKDPWEEEIIGSVPVTLKERARLLIRRIKNSNGKLGWNTRGELTRSGIPIPNTNIVDLVGDVIRKRKTIAAPSGATHFMSGLRDINTPQEAVGNKARLKLPYQGASAAPEEEEEEEEEDLETVEHVKKPVKRLRRTKPRQPRQPRLAKQWISW